MVGLAIVFVAVWVWIIYDVVDAPLVDENYNIIEEDEKIKKK